MKIGKIIAKVRLVLRIKKNTVGIAVNASVTTMYPNELSFLPLW